MRKYIYMPLPEGCDPDNARILVQAVDPDTNTFIQLKQNCLIEEEDLQKQLCASVLLDGIVGLLEAYNAPEDTIKFFSELTTSDVINLINLWGGIQTRERHNRPSQSKYTSTHPSDDPIAVFLKENGII